MRMARIMPEDDATTMRIITVLSISVSLSVSTFAATLDKPVDVTASAPVATYVQRSPSISMTPSSTFLVWDEDATRGGRMSGRKPMNVSTMLDTAISRDGGAASIGEQSAGVWLQGDWMYAQLFDADGNRTGAPAYLAMVDARHTSRLGVAAGNDRYLVAWPLQSRLVASTVDMTGHIVTDALQLSGGTYLRNVETVHVASLGDEFLVVWDATPDEPWSTPCDVGCPGADHDVHMVIVGTDGLPKQGTERVLATSAAMPDVASNGNDDYFVVWTGAKSGIVQGVHIARGGSVAGTAVTLATDGWGPRVAWDGKAYDLAYSHWPGQDLRAMRLDANGNASEVIGDATSIAGSVSPRQFGIAAQNGVVALTYIDTDHLVVRYGKVGVTVTRAHAVRH
jgi:hypothetical protein